MDSYLTAKESQLLVLPNTYFTLNFILHAYTSQFILINILKTCRKIPLHKKRKKKSKKVLI